MKESKPRAKLSEFFQIVCIVAAISMLIWCLWEYSKNEDVVEVAFKKYGKEDQSIYPDITLCFDYPFYEEKLKSYDDELSSLIYSMFLAGQDFWGLWDERILQINYENVSLQLKNHIIGNAMVFPSKTGISLNNNISLDKIYSFGTPGFKCFTFPLPTGLKIIKFVVVIKNSVFPLRIRPQKGFEVLLHYPQQKFRSEQFRVKNWPVRTNMSSKSYQIDVDVKDVEVLKRRHKYK